MTISNLPQVLTVEEVAQYLKTNPDTVNKEMEEGRIRAFKVGEEWRCTDTSLMEYISRNGAVSGGSLPANHSLHYEEGSFTEIESFDYDWPKLKEHFEYGYETTRDINGRTHTFRIGFANRQAAGQMRRRVVVWINNWPVVEFAGGNKYESDGLLASVIKVEGGKQLRPSGKIPNDYKAFHVARYDSIVQGPYASRNMAVIVQKDDLESMIRHAIIRATWKELI